MTVDHSEAISFFSQGRLDEAIATAASFLKRNPADAGLRISLAEYVLFAGDFERADKLLASAEAVDANLALVVAEFRQLLRAAKRRRNFADEGQPPDFLGTPTEMQTALLRAAVLLRAGDRSAAALAAEAAEAGRRKLAGRHNSKAFDDFRDTDDTVGSNIEVLTTTGRFFWIDAADILSMTMHALSRPRDLIWRRCTMSVRNGPDGEVYLPALYGGGVVDSNELRLGRTTEWNDEPPIQGRGQRVLLLGEEGIAFHELGSIEFEL